MLKQKTRKAAAKRFRFTKSGKIVRKCAGMRHLLGTKSSKRKRGLGKSHLVSHSDEPRVRSMLAGRN